MPTLRRLTALAIARAMLAGEPSADGLAARVRNCIEGDGPWVAALARRLARLSVATWGRLSVRSLAELIERDDDYHAAWHAEHRPYPRRYILRSPTQLPPPPLGLDECQRPAWPHVGALAAQLGVSIEGLWRLTRCAPWQRRLPLAEQHHRYRLIPKRDGSWRLLEIPHPYLMRLQRKVLDMLLDRIPPHQAAHGFASGRGLIDHLETHVGQAVLLKFDLGDFFTSVRASRVHALFTTLGYSDEVASTLTALCTTSTPEPVLCRLREDGGMAWSRAQRLRDAHLAQGAPSSPALANLCAFRLDLRLDGLASGLGARYSRYADDIVLSGPIALRHARERIERWVGRIVVEEGFVLNHRKTRLQLAGQRQSICNVTVNRRRNIARQDFDTLKAILHRSVHHGPSSQNRQGVPRWREHLAGRVAWAEQVNPAKAARLRRLFDAIDWSR